MSDDLMRGLAQSLEEHKWVIAAKVVAEGIILDAEAGKRPKDESYKQAQTFLADLQKSDPQ